MGPRSPTGQLNQVFRLRDGRQLGFAEYGDLAGAPFMYCHGWPSSRLEPQAVAEVIRASGLRLVAADRPGYGLSDACPGRRIADWVEDVTQLAEHLGWSRFGVLGVSGGGPYTAACAVRIPDRLTAVVMVCALGPVDDPAATEGMVGLNRRLLAFARNAPWLAQVLATSCMRLFWGHGEQVIPEEIEARLPPADQQVLARREVREALIASSREALRPGPHGAASDGLLYARPWGFRLEEVRVPVRLWHGEQDVVVPPAMGRYIARKLPNCQATFTAEDGHFSLPFGRLGEILRPV